MPVWTRILLVLAGLMGAAGVAAAAAAAHVGGGANLETAAHFLLFHAAALVGLGALGLMLGRGRVVLYLGASAMALGVLLFSGDLAARALMEVKLLGGSAPFGGSLTILGWLLVAVGALVGRRA
ncbi:DUF423 domain-containing protein [Xanthobacter autotrophicus]|uniref:DUF423 domain-containing protein n=1 Tax=Xanthobacter TaxID=279 RepID=UPI0024ABAB88|nr:DUF423 domain-containing protein [Xanthobacter autotrophicus]MDI4666434.1 DUF423 domain-containing protein [Xanthobacter autotrophicus]